MEKQLGNGKKKSMTDITFGSLMFVISLSLAICLLISSNQKNDLRKQAVERGHAEYVVDSDGKTTWQWKDKQ
jgi:hypothetical protein